MRARGAGAVLPTPFEGCRDGHGFGDAGGFDDDVLEVATACERADGFHQVLTQCATDAAVSEFDEAVFAAREVAFAGDEGGVDVDFREVIDDHRDATATSIGQQVV